MKKFYFKIMFLVLALAFVLGNWGTVQAETYPEKDIVLHVPWAAGGSTDTAARLIAPILSEIVNKNVTVENFPGASGVMGLTQYLKYKPDGYRILFGTAGAFTSQKYLQKLPYDPLNDFAPTGGVFAEEVFVAVSSSAPYNTLKEMEAYWKRKGEKVKMCAAGVGSIGDVMNRVLAEQMNIDAVFIPYKNLGAAAVALMGGHADVAIVTGQIAKPAVDEGRIKLLGFIGDKSSKYFSDVPTSKEQGYNISLISWQSTFVSKNVPAPIVQKIEKIIKQLVMSEKLIEKTKKAKIAIYYMTPTEQTANIEKQQKIYGKVLKELGLAKK